MADSQPARVLILCRSPGDTRRLELMLAAREFHVWGDAAAIPAMAVIDVIVSDFESVELAAAAPSHDQQHAFAIVSIAPAVGGDVQLPVDCTARELRLACQLSAKIARLRSQRDELARDQAAVMQLAETDPLTGLANRRAWDARLSAMLARAARGGESLWLALVDLDAFKAINDRDGMTRGDAVLVATGKALAAAVRGDDLVARLGGDEFGILLSDVSDEQVVVVLDRLRASVAKGGDVTASVGYVPGKAGAERGPLLAAAERAMRAAKRAGGNRVVAAEPSS